ncbi:hypothetical protein AVEN_219851-1, partial [Araneus ventricosus]
RVSVIISPIKRIRNIVKDRRIETEESSCSSEAKRYKDFESSSVTIIQNDSKNIFPYSKDIARRDYSSTEHSASLSSSISMLPDEQVITLDSTNEENASNDCVTTPSSHLSLLLACF